MIEKKRKIKNLLFIYRTDLFYGGGMLTSQDKELGKSQTRIIYIWLGFGFSIWSEWSQFLSPLPTHFIYNSWVKKNYSF